MLGYNSMFNIEILSQVSVKERSIKLCWSKFNYYQTEDIRYLISFFTSLFLFYYIQALADNMSAYRTIKCVTTALPDHRPSVYIGGKGIFKEITKTHKNHPAINLTM